MKIRNDLFPFILVDGKLIVVYDEIVIYIRGTIRNQSNADDFLPDATLILELIDNNPSNFFATRIINRQSPKLINAFRNIIDNCPVLHIDRYPSYPNVASHY